MSMKVHRITTDLVFPFTFGAVTVRVGQGLPVGLGQAIYTQCSIDADRMMGDLATATYAATDLLGQFILDGNFREGSVSHTSGTWLDIKDRHVSLRTTIETTRVAPHFVLIETIDRILRDFRRVVAVAMDPSYAAYMAEQEAQEMRRTFMEAMGHIGDPHVAEVILAQMLGKGGGSRSIVVNAGGQAVMPGVPFGSFAGGNGFARG